MKKFKDVTRDKKISSIFPLASILGAPPENQGNEGIPGGDVWIWQRYQDLWYDYFLDKNNLKKK